MMWPPSTLLLPQGMSWGCRDVGLHSAVVLSPSYRRRWGTVGSPAEARAMGAGRRRKGGHIRGEVGQTNREGKEDTVENVEDGGRRRKDESLEMIEKAEKKKGRVKDWRRPKVTKGEGRGYQEATFKKQDSTGSKDSGRIQQGGMKEEVKGQRSSEDRGGAVQAMMQGSRKGHWEERAREDEYSFGSNLWSCRQESDHLILPSLQHSLLLHSLHVSK